MRSRAAGTVTLVVLAGTGWAAPAHAVPQSTTSLVLSSPTSAYGQAVTAIAQVVVPGGPAEGVVVFAVDGTSVKANLRGDGTASAVLPRTLVGAHPVTATFVPQFPDRQLASTSPTVGWVVAPVRTRLQVRVTGRGAHIPTKVVLAAAGEYGTLPEGAVKVTVRHLGTRKRARRERTLDAAGMVVARFGTLRTGRYRLRITYAGDSQHLTERHSERFTVRQR